MKPEEEVEIKLWDWLKTRASFIQEIYFNRKNLINDKIFTTRGLNKKPDLIISFDRGYGLEYAAIEVKNAARDRNVYDASKIIDYYSNYSLEKTKYYIENKEIKIKYFLVASEHSINGHLLKNEKGIINNLNSVENGGKIGRINAVELGLIPKQEYERTRQFSRELFEQFKRKRLEKDFIEKPAIGILTSDFYETKSPHIFIICYTSWTIKQKWGQRIWKI